MKENTAKLIIFTGPSGVGKGTMLADFFRRVDNNIVYSISNTGLKAWNRGCHLQLAPIQVIISKTSYARALTA